MNAPPSRERTGAQLIGPASAPVRLYSPLHDVSEHFVERLSESLEAGGVPSIRLESRNGEVAGSLRAKALALGAHIKNGRRYAREGGPNVVAWPLLGWLDMPLWRHYTNQTFIAMHDPEPLARQNGLSPRAAALSRKLSGSKWPHLVTMSPEAHDVAARYFAPERIHLAPHPMRAPSSDSAVRPVRTVLVLGQYKPARDLDAMAAIAPSLTAAGWNPTVAGRGWPPIPGWQLINRFLPEEEFHELLASASVVLLPYRYYFQSGVALRALEAGVPVVGRSTGFLTSILGANFPGAVGNWDDPSSWLAAVEAAALGRSDQMRSASTYSRLGSSEWCALLQQSGELTGQ
ncbi:glycosyltransferase [Mycobacterium hodleri]|uniref:glycosyltransferase n=1 Tax=Mycolicibacterium hodleri TaxID=49897 RepID=UPI0021F3486F|nr:glycosyltransferase [Mycolicibacterium hodleri]MCV7136630.1 glycosyltransferase [Mycolicibacterium hodleri]